MKGYWRKPSATKETLTVDGWLKTGDIAYFDSLDEVHIVDRKKVCPLAPPPPPQSPSPRQTQLTSQQELIKVKGFQVAPAELEALLLDHPAVQDVAVIGVSLYLSLPSCLPSSTHPFLPLPPQPSYQPRTNPRSAGEEVPRAYIVAPTPAQATLQAAESIKAWLAERVSRAKRLDGGVVFVEGIPKNPVSFFFGTVLGG